jgi:hypothetical protein
MNYIIFAIYIILIISTNFNFIIYIKMGQEYSIPKNYKPQGFIVEKESVAPFFVDVARINGLVDPYEFTPVMDEYTLKYDFNNPSPKNRIYFKYVIYAKLSKLIKLYNKLVSENIATIGPKINGIDYPYIDYNILINLVIPQKTVNNRNGENRNDENENEDDSESESESESDSESDSESESEAENEKEEID